jgi:hypothetical protein
MKAMVVFLALALSGSVFAKKPVAIQEVDVSSVRDQFKVYKISSGHILVLIPFGDTDMLFWGKPNGVLYRQQVRSSFSDVEDEMLDLVVVDRRFSRNGYSLEFRNGQKFATCGTNRMELTPVDKSTGESLLSGAQFTQPLWNRQSHYLARDDYGVYYFVDKPMNYDDAKIDESSYRVFIGWKGEILQSPLKMVAQDSVGEVYGMTNGNRRIVINNGSGRYFDGDEVRVLHALNFYMDSGLMYRDGGVYGNAPQGTPCDWFFESK